MPRCSFEASVILFPLRKLRSIRITDLVFTFAKRLSSSIPLALHSGYKLLTLQIAAVFAPFMILSPARRTSSPSHPMISGVRSAHSPSQMNPRPGPALHPSTKEWKLHTFLPWIFPQVHAHFQSSLYNSMRFQEMGLLHRIIIVCTLFGL